MFAASAGAFRCEVCPPGTFSAGGVGCQSVVQVAATVGAWFAVFFSVVVLLLVCRVLRLHAAGGASGGLKASML
jgi:hypothetical protein